MFNKSILVALILCACYLGAIQADVLPGGALGPKILLITENTHDALKNAKSLVPKVPGVDQQQSVLSSVPL